MQRMLSLSMNDDMKEAKTEKVKLLEELGNDENLAKKVENFVANEEARRSIGVTNVEGKLINAIRTDLLWWDITMVY